MQKGGEDMNSKEALEKLLKENEDALEKFKKLGEVSEEDAEKELRKFEKEFGIELRKEDFAGKELNDGQLKNVSGGADGMSVADVIGIVSDVYGFIDRPEDTRRGTTRGSKRFN